MTTPKSFDYIVIGAGSAGCVAAARLAESNMGTVLLLEAGAPADQHPETLTADGFKDAFSNDALMWHRMTSKQTHCGGRNLYAGTGRAMGGSGSVNGMVYTRGDKQDFVNWPAGWQWNDLCPAFDALEQKLNVQPRPPTAFVQRFIDASVEVGFKRKDGLNDGELGGYVGCNDINYQGEQRRSSYRAWLHDNDLPNLTIVTDALVHKLVFDDSQTAIAVEYSTQGKTQRVGINKEAVLCAGALETPKLLMLSGVGDAADLTSHDIPVVLNAPAIGQNLQDHPNVCLFYRTKAEVDFKYPQVYGFDAARRKPEDKNTQAPDSCFVCYAAPASIKESMLRMLPVLALPGRLHNVKALRALLRGLIHAAFAIPSLKRFVSGVFGIVVILGKPTSRGSIRLASKDPRDAAIIDPAYYTSEHDRETIEAGIRKARHIAGQPALSSGGVWPLSAGAKATRGNKLWKWINTATMTTFHFCGSCRMGNDADSPVDTQLKVKGLSNVRVADASVIPEIPVSALNAPSMMIGYRVAEFILANKKVSEAA